MGASFFQELLAETGLLKTQLEQALGELVAAGLISSDSFQGLRLLILPQKTLQRRSKRYRVHDPLASAGRWSILRPAMNHTDDSYAPVEHIAKTLLARYGVVFRKILDKEEGIPSWRELIYIYRRLEARGEIRGGRFVQGFAGEQFALPQAINALRELRKQPKTGELVAISSADPLNLTGVITPGERVGIQSGHRVLFQDGIPIACGSKTTVSFLREFSEAEQHRLKKACLGG